MLTIMLRRLQGKVEKGVGFGYSNSLYEGGGMREVGGGRAVGIPCVKMCMSPRQSHVVSHYVAWK